MSSFYDFVFNTKPNNPHLFRRFRPDYEAVNNRKFEFFTQKIRTRNFEVLKSSLGWVVPKNGKKFRNRFG